nr:DUF4219 domain-containing protein/UBN2 domain-containing protein [Tanacetum cinerariifolium]
MVLPNLTPITKLATYKSTKTNRNLVVQVKRIEKTERHKYKLQLSDGSDFHDAYVDSTLKKSKQLEEGSPLFDCGNIYVKSCRIDLDDSCEPRVVIPSLEWMLSINKEPVRRSPEAEAPGTTFRQSSQYLDYEGFSMNVQPGCNLKHLLPSLLLKKKLFQQQYVIKSQELWELVENGIAETSVDETGRRESMKKDAKALFFIQQAVDETIFLRIAAANSDKEAWDTLKMEYQVQEYLARISSIVSQMRAYDDKVADEIVVAKILRSLSPKFDHVVAAIEESKYLSTYFVDELMGSLQTHEARINKNMAKEDEHAFCNEPLRKEYRYIIIMASHQSIFKKA